MENQPRIGQYALNHFQAAFVPSKCRKIMVLAMVLVLMLVAMGFYFGAMRWIFGAAIAVCGWWAWQEPTDFIDEIIVQPQHAYLQIHRQKCSARLLSGSLISRYVCCLRWQCGKRVIWQWIFPDMLPENDFRRLRVWAKWCQY